MSFTSTFSAASINGYKSFLTGYGLSAILVPSTPTANSGFGSSVAINTDGSYIAINQNPGLFGSNNPGYCYIFTGSPASYTQQQRISPSTGNATGFGTSISINTLGDTIAVGSYTSSTGGLPYNGNAYIFTRSTSTWTQQQVLRGSDSQNNDQFGTQLSLDGSGNYLAVSASDFNSGAGAIYIFLRSGTTWTQQQKLTPISGSNFGSSLKMSKDGTYLVATTSFTGGGISIYTRSGTTWSLQQTITIQVQSVTISATNDTIIAGGVFGGINSNTLFYYKRVGTTWSLQQTITNSTYVIHGAQSINDSSNILTSPLIYTFNSSSIWNFTQKLTLPSGSTDLGYSIINGNGNIIIVPDPYYDTGYTNSGAVYVYY